MKHLHAKKIATYALLISLAMILSYIESMLPIPFFMPGMKLGLANIVTVVTLYRMGVTGAASVSLLRIILSSLLFGNVFSLAYSFAGGAFSLGVMILLKKTGRFAVAGVSISGAVCHNLAQIGVAALLLETSELLYYLPALLISGAVTGTVIGMLGGLIIKKLPSSI
jgi:heptaprenyl diphosphate synthase